METPEGFTRMDRYDFALFTHGDVGDFALARSSGFFQAGELIPVNSRVYYVANSALDRLSKSRWMRSKLPISDKDREIIRKNPLEPGWYLRNLNQK